MVLSHPFRLQKRAGLFVAGLLLALFGANAAEAQRILILHSFNRDFAPYNYLSSSFRTELAQALPEPMEFYEESLDAARLGEMETETENPFLGYLDSRFADHRLDLLVTFGGPAARFSLRHRQHFFPNTPMLIAGIEQRHLQDVTLAGNDAAVPFVFDLPGIIEHILTVLPDTRKVVVIIGASRLEKFWQAEMRREFQPFSGRVEFDWLNELSLEEMKRRAASLPPRTAILYGMLAIDGAGIPHEQDQALTSLYAVANAPIFGLFDTQLGLGIVGGPLTSMREITDRSVDAALRLLRGEPLAGVATAPVVAGTHQYDWRELARWHIAEERLPAGSLIRFRPRSPWQEYKMPILVGIGIVATQAILIFALLVQRARARKAEQASRILSARLVTVYEDERRRVARELHDDITQRLAGLAMEAARIEQADDIDRKSHILGNLRAELGRLSEDVHTLSYQLHPAVLDDLGLPEALRSTCGRFARAESIPVHFVSRGLPSELPRNAALCLFRIAQEALRNVARHARASAVEVSLMMVDGGLQLTVGDDGIGFDPAEAFARGHIGHTSMGERVKLLGGELDIDTSPGNGTLVVAWIPMERKRHEQHE
jgi:signal transduction histidine kinase